VQRIALSLHHPQSMLRVAIHLQSMPAAAAACVMQFPRDCRREIEIYEIRVFVLIVARALLQTINSASASSDCCRIASRACVFITLLCPRPRGNFGIARSFRLSVLWRSCLGYRHAGCLQFSHRRPPEMWGLRTRPRTDVDPPQFLPPSNCHRLDAPGR